MAVSDILSQEHPDLSAGRDCNCLSLRRASRRISLYYDACLAPVDLRATQFPMLVALAREGALSINRLAALLDMDRSTAGQNVKVLERDGLIDAVRAADDGRVRLLKLTAAGHAKLAEAIPLWAKAQSGVEALNGQADMAALRKALGQLQLPVGQS